MVEFLFQNGADPSLRTRKGMGPGHLSARCYQLEEGLLSVLANWDVDLLATDLEDRTMLHHAAISGSLAQETLDFLEDVGLSRHSRDKWEKTPLDYAAQKAADHRDAWNSDRWIRAKQILQGGSS